MFTYAHTYSIYVLLESVCPGHYFVILFSLFATYLPESTVHWVSQFLSNSLFL